MSRNPDVPRALLLRAKPAAARPIEAAPRLLTRDGLEARRTQRRSIVAKRTSDPKTHSREPNDR